MATWRRVIWLAIVAVAGCAGPKVEYAGERYTACKTNDDCDDDEKCECTGVGTDPCGPGTDAAKCAEARCGLRLCFNPKHRPPPPP
jgi:hypothetical protein